jgi:hypothetical protein
MTSKRRLSTDELVNELLAEIRTDREVARGDRAATAKRQKEITDRLDRFETALVTLSSDLRDFRQHTEADSSETRRQVRVVSNAIGLTNPHEQNGSK